MGKRVKSLVAWAVTLGLGVPVAVLLAQWWAGRAERQFQAQLQRATVAELRITAQKRDWDPTVYYWLGVKLTQQAQPDAAVLALTRSVALDPHDAAARTALEKARAAASASKDERLRSMTVPELQRLVAQQPDNPESNYWLGAQLSAERRDTEALPFLLRSLQSNPGSAAARAAFGLALARTGKPGEAEAQLKRAIAIDPKLQFAHFSLGNLYGKFGRWGQAATELKMAADLDPNDTEAQYLLATTYGETYQEDKKLEILENLVRRDPNNVRYLTSLGYVYLFFGKFGQAEALYRKILQQTPDNQEAHYLYGRSLAEQASTPQEFAQAERELTGVIQKVPNDPGVHLALGILYFRRSEPARAVPELERAVKLGVRENKTWLYLGQAYGRVGRTADARRTLETFQRIAGANRDITQLENRLFNVPDDTAARRRLIAVYLGNKDYAHALNHLNMLLAKNPQDAEARRLTRECQAHQPKSVTPQP
jgi:tetratricopeptide (TPR) repeat protein